RETRLPPGDDRSQELRAERDARRPRRPAGRGAGTGGGAAVSRPGRAGCRCRGRGTRPGPRSRSCRSDQVQAAGAPPAQHPYLSGWPGAGANGEGAGELGWKPEAGAVNRTTESDLKRQFRRFWWHRLRLTYREPTIPATEAIAAKMVDAHTV